MIVASLLTLFLMVMIAGDVLLRYATGSGFRGSTEVAEVILPAVAYLAMAYTQRRGEHVASSVVLDRLPTRPARMLHSAGMVVVTAFLAVLLLVTTESAIDSANIRESRYGLLGLAVWPTRILLAIGLLALLLENLADTWECVRSSNKKGSGVQVVPGAPETQGGS
ncbi:TRAP transporter small permease subunit [Nocardioides seonyuensis]|nr:TRAP transporter small permease [Nocardioides seonyuensis]